MKYIEVAGVGHDAPILISGREMQIFNWLNDHPLWGNTHLLLCVQPNQDIYAKGQSLTLSIIVLNQDNPALEGILTLTVSGFGDYGYFDFQTINVAANGIGEYSFTWTVPEAPGTYIVETSLAPVQLTAYDAKWVQTN